MNGRARTVIAAVALAALIRPSDALAQITSRPTPEPIVTAENTPWYLAGEPITFSGNIYYPAGPQVFFNRYEMIRSGFYEGIPLYSRTTIEPFSIVYVPVGGGLMQPYERRRAGDVAGTSGSTTPTFPVITAAEEAYPGVLPQAAAPPYRVAISIGDTSRELTEVTPGTNQGFGPPPPAVGTAGRDVVVLPAAPAPAGPLRSARRPQGINGVFIEYDNRRWFSSGPAVELSAEPFTRIGEYQGFAVYMEPGKEGTIYVAATAGGSGLLTPYSLRR